MVEGYNQNVQEKNTIVLILKGPFFWTYPVMADDLDELYAPEEASKYSDSDSDDNEVVDKEPPRLISKSKPGQHNYAT